MYLRDLNFLFNGEQMIIFNFLIALFFSLTSWSYSDEFKKIILEASDKLVALPAITEANIDVVVANSIDLDNPHDLEIINQLTRTLRLQDCVIQKNGVYETVSNEDVCRSIARLMESPQKGGQVVANHIEFTEISEDDLENITLRYFGPWQSLNLNKVRSLAREFQEFYVVLKTSDAHWKTISALEIFEAARNIEKRYRPVYPSSPEA